MGGRSLCESAGPDGRADSSARSLRSSCFFFQAEDGIRDVAVTGVQTCALPIFTGEVAIPSTDWKFCGGGTFAAPLPLTALPVKICLNGGFNVNKLYQVVYTAKDPDRKSVV